MPLFEYKCDSCGHQFEELVSSSDTEVVCPKCGDDKVKRLLSVFAASSGQSAGASSCGAPSCGSGFS